MRDKAEEGDAPAGGRTVAVMQAIRERIAAALPGRAHIHARNRGKGAALAAGERLPSIRALAAAMGVSPSTVVEAYDRLAAEGLIRARPGSGFYVCGRAAPPLSLALPASAARAERAVDPFWVSRQSLDADPDALKPGCGWLPPDWMPMPALRRALRAAAKGGEGLLTDYGATLGSPALRRLILSRFAAEGLEIGPDRLMLTGSGTQAIDLICRLLLRPGDTVLIDDPCYFNFRALLRAHQANVVGVPYTPAGPDIAAFEAAARQARPRLYITNSALHNPTGATISAQAAHRVLTIAGAHDITVVEDDIFADFEPEPSPRLALLDGLERVIRIGSFSKTLSAAMRCGYIAGPAERIEALADLQLATNFGGPSPVVAQAILDVLSGGSYRKHVEELRRRLDRARRDTAARLIDLGIRPWTMPRGGFYLWCGLPEGADSAALARVALSDKVVLAPGNVFSTAQTAGGFMRFNVAQCADPKVMAVLSRAMHRA